MNDNAPARRHPAIPAHLPDRLAISCWIWSWIVAATSGEPYDDLERCVRETRERGFDAIRIETGLNWAFRADGSPRGPVPLGPWIDGYGWNFSSVNARGGGRIDVLMRLLKLFELAGRHGLYVILTSWEYQDSTWFVADPALRAEVEAVPREERFMRLAQLHDRLLTILEDHGLDRRVAWVEVHNEPEYSEMPGGAEGRRLHEEAIAYLRDRHPRVLVSADFSSHDPAIVPANAQVYDQHVYAGGTWYFRELFGKTVLDPAFDPADPRALEPLRRVLREGDLVPWEDFMRPAENVRPFWRPIMWLYENLDNDRWDAWVAERYAEWRDRIAGEARSLMTADAAEAGRRGLPLVLDEGGLFYPPRLSRFEITPAGLETLEIMADLAIAHGYWGFMPGTYCGPEHIVWRENPDWLRQINGRFRRGVRTNDAGSGRSAP